MFDSDEAALAYANGLVDRSLELEQRFPDLSDNEVEEYLELFGGPARKNAQKLIDRREKYASGDENDYRASGLEMREPIKHGEKVVVRYCHDEVHANADNTPPAVLFFIAVNENGVGTINEIGDWGEAEFCE